MSRMSTPTARRQGRLRRQKRKKQGATLQPHDALFRYTFSQREHAASLLRAVLPPALAAAVDWRTLRIEKGSFVDDNLRSRHSDLVLSARLRGATIYFHTLVEHQRDVETLMMLRMGIYMMRLWEQIVRDDPARTDLPVIFPILVHHSNAGWTAATAFQDLIPVEPSFREVLSPFIPHFQVRLVDLSEGQATHIVDEVLTPLARVALWCMSVAGNDERLERELYMMREALEEIVQAPNGYAALGVVMRYIATTHRRLDVERMSKLMETAGGPRTKESWQLWVEEFDRNYKRKIRRNIERQVDRNGRAEMLLQLIAARFGSVPTEVSARIKAARRSALDQWALRVLTAKTPEEVVAAGDGESAHARPSKRAATRTPAR